MFEYFPGNYVWNLGVVGALNRRADRRGRPRLPADQRDRTARRRCRDSRLLASLDGPHRATRRPGREGGGGRPRPHRRATYARATNYLCRAERMLSNSDPSRIPAYRRVLQLQQKAFDLRDPQISRVAIPFEGTTCQAYFSPAAPLSDEGPAPVVVLVNGLDSTKEHMYASGFWGELAARGISCLMLDQPGTGEALRLQELTAGSTRRRGRVRWWTGCSPAVMSTRLGSASWAGRWAAITPHAPQRSRSGSPSALPGAPITTGAQCSAAGSNAKESDRYPTIGSTSSGCGVTPTCRSS